jgi:hypothetical protein
MFRNGERGTLFENIGGILVMDKDNLDLLLEAIYFILNSK